MVPLLQVQLVQALAFQESPASSTSPSLVMQYSCWLLFTGSKGFCVSSVVAHTSTSRVTNSVIQRLRQDMGLCAGS